MKRLYLGSHRFCLIALPFLLSGCYTQLYTQGYGNQSLQSNYHTETRPYAEADSFARDSLAASTPTPTDSLSGSLSDSASAKPAAAKTASRPAGTPTVIVNNYYDPYDTYRGYAAWEWGYPSLSLGFYSSSYRLYNHPYWWSRPSYRPRGYFRDYRGYSDPRPYRPGQGTVDSPRKETQRLYAPEPVYAVPRKGRRSTESAPETRQESAPRQEASDPRPTSMAPATPTAPEDNQGGDTEPPRKGRRR